MTLSDTNIFDPDFGAYPYAFYQDAISTAPVLYLPGLETWLVTGAEAIIEICASPAIFSNDISVLLAGTHSDTPEVQQIMAGGWPQVQVLLMSDPPNHSRHRRLVGMAFSVHRINAIEADIRAVSKGILSRLDGKAQWDFVEDYAIPMPVGVISSQLGLSVEDTAKVRFWSDAFTDRLGGMISQEREIECARAVVEFQQSMKVEIDKRRKEHHDDLLGDLVKASAEGDAPLSDAEILSVIQQIMVAGNETSTSTMAEGLKLLIENPDQMALLRRNPDLIPNAAEEILRLASPVSGSWRIATQDTNFHGHEIKAGAKIMIRFAAASRDSARFERPDDMDITRKNAKLHFAFGRGIHTCLGNMLARREIQICLSHLIECYSEIQLGTHVSELNYPPNVMLRGLRALPIRVTPKEL